MLFLNQDAQQRGIKAESVHGQRIHAGLSEKNMGMLSEPLDPGLFHNEDRLTWYADWCKKAVYALQKLYLERAPELDNPVLHLGGTGGELTNVLRECSISQSVHLLSEEQWKVVWCTIEKIYRSVAHCDYIWKETNKSLGKRRALSELLKLLESSGLSRHKSVYMEDHYKSWWFLEPSYDMQHLLLTQNRLASGAPDVVAICELRSFPGDILVPKWKVANENYFKSIASVLLLQQTCLNSHKDISREQVDRSIAFVNQLIDIQQKQQIAANDFAKQLKHLRECISTLEHDCPNSPSSDIKTVNVCSLSQNQHATFKCMWQQKQLLDDLCAMLSEESLLLNMFEITHLDSCERVKAAAGGVLAFIAKSLQDFLKSKKLLDYYLLGQNKAIKALAGSSYCFVVTKQMEQLVSNNFQAIKEFEECLLAFRGQEINRSSVTEVLLSHFEELFEKGKLVEEEFNSQMSTNKHSNSNCFEFDEALNSTFQHVMDTLKKLVSSGTGRNLPEESAENITSWKFVFDSLVTDLRLDLLCEKILKTIVCGEQLLGHSGNDTSNAVEIGVQFKYLHVLLSVILDFGDALLQDVLAMYRTVSLVTHVLANVLASLFSKGYGVPAEDQVDDANCDKLQDASGTGMGEGVGKNDVSDQITDEDQLLGALEKPSEEQGASDEAPSKNEKGIEMEQDFAADTYSVSEDSEEDNNEDSEDEQLESAMGETGANGEVMDEKLWNKDEDENPSKANEKYESGSSVRDQDTSCRELRAKDDDAAIADEPGELKSDEKLDSGETDKKDDEFGSEDNTGDLEDTEDMQLNKEEAFADPTGLKLDELNQNAGDDMDMDEENVADSGEEADPIENEESDEMAKDEEENTCPSDEAIGEAETEQIGGDLEKDLEKDQKENVEMNSTDISNNALKPGSSEFATDNVANAESTTQPKGDSQTSDARNIVSESNWSGNTEAHNDLAPLRGLPATDSTEVDFSTANLSNSGRYTNDQSKGQSAQPEALSTQKSEPNPYRSVGEALQEWKERVRVSVDLPTDNIEAQDEIEDENADEYGFVSEFEKGTAQALGPATSEQVDKSVDGLKQDGDSLTTHENNAADMEIDEQNSEAPLHRSSALIHKNKIEEHITLSGLEKSPSERSEDVQSHDDGNPERLSDSLVSVKKSFLSEGVNQFSKLSVSEDEFGKVQDPVEVSNAEKINATVLWRRYELLTTRLSQELAEQLRLVMEPTLASKLQGDYKTGKRINMKKVIPYIASHYRKDKIWLRRTRPNKRDYQVVIAVDDSRSMSESGCGNVAIEALVTVCRAMSQLEMGKMAVASFGKKGNIRLLHDFDQPFSGETGMKMISSLTFKQENTIADEPVVDLLKYLNEMLDVAVAKARLPSGQNPLQQLVLIIADGRFHEKENLKRCVRDALSRKRMVAFLLLDSPQESIMELMEASFEGGNIKFSKYMDSFPFPYYIVLRNIEALPRTLSDLLRQWFELMQQWRD